MYYYYDCYNVHCTRVLYCYTHDAMCLTGTPTLHLVHSCNSSTRWLCPLVVEVCEPFCLGKYKNQ